jgi:hypothetical protein
MRSKFDSHSTYTYVDKLAKLVKQSDGRYVIKPILFLENKNGDYIGVNRSADGIFDNAETLFGNDLGTKYPGYLNRLADGRLRVVDKDNVSLIGETLGDIKLDYLNMTDETRIIIKNKASTTQYLEFTKDTFTSSVATELSNIQYVINNANEEELSADLLIMYAETSNFEKKMHDVTYSIEANGNVQ